MDINSLGNLSFSTDMISGGLNSASAMAESIAPSASNLSIQQILIMVAGLFFLRTFGGMFFAVFALFGIIVSSFVSVVCCSIGTFVRLITKTIISTLNVFGGAGSGLIDIFCKTISFTLFKTKSILIPAFVSMLLSFFYIQGESWSSSALSYIFPSAKTSWIELEDKSENYSLEKF